MVTRVARSLAALVIVAASSTAMAERTSHPPEATVYVRVIGTARAITKGPFSETREERNIELATGSGFVFTPYGHVLTNHHVIESTTVEERLGRRDVEIMMTVERIEVVLPGRELGRFEASVEAVDEELDLAVLSINGGELPYLALGDSEAAEQGDGVRVYGFPFGNRVEVGRSDVPDIVPTVSASQGSLAAVRSDDSGETAYLQTTATVNPGSSGGPMVDEDGYVLGVIRLKLRDSDGIGFAIPVNTVKEFLSFNGYDQMLPVTPLRLGPEQTLERKGLTLRLPDTFEDISPTRLRAFSDPSEHDIDFSSDRVATTWSLAQLEEALLSGGTFGSFSTATEIRSRPLGDGRGVLGRASSGPVSMEYLVVDLGPEKLVMRYQGSGEALAFNRSVIVNSLESVRAGNLLTRELARTLAADRTSWVELSLPAPSAPTVVVPGGWDDEISAPFFCRGLPAWESALAVSPPGDFTVSLRAGWWPFDLDPVESARACSGANGAMGQGSYSYTVDWLGERYVVEGVFAAKHGTMQLELVAPVRKHGFIREVARTWMEQNSTRSQD